ncbi:MAG: hypothetical protein WCX69_06285, partial [Candidatus Paceibacterota bacterium]
MANEIVAISVSDYNQYGCPNCGKKSVILKIGGMGTQWVDCTECGKRFSILNDGQKKARIGIGEPTVYPALQ